MYNSYLQPKWGFIIGFLLFCCMSCTEKSIYKFTTFLPKVIDTINVKDIKLYLETSASMRGYVNSNVSGAYPLKDLVPFIVTDLDNHFGNKTQLITISDRQNKFPYSKNKFFEHLRNGKMFSGKSSKLQNIFSSIVSEIKYGEISILISDCIPDLGEINTKTEGSQITSHIYTAISANKTLGAAIFQYKSDFNGTYYFNRQNNDGVTQARRPFYNKILHNRPFYVWVLGDQTLVNKVLSTGIIKGYDAAHAYNISFNIINAGLLENPISGKISINTERQTILVKEIDAKRPALFTVGINGSFLSKIQQEHLSDTEMYTVTPQYVQENIEIKIKQKEGLLLEDIKDKAEIEKSIYTHFMQLTLNEFDLETEEFNINIFNKEPRWIKNTNLEDDVAMDAAVLEHKTFGFNFITDAFNKAYPATAAQFQFTLTKLQK